MNRLCSRRLQGHVAILFPGILFNKSLKCFLSVSRSNFQAPHKYIFSWGSSSLGQLGWYWCTLQLIHFRTWKYECVWNPYPVERIPWCDFGHTLTTEWHLQRCRLLSRLQQPSDAIYRLWGLFLGHVRYLEEIGCFPSWCWMEWSCADSHTGNSQPLGSFCCQRSRGASVGTALRVSKWSLNLELPLWERGIWPPCLMRCWLSSESGGSYSWRSRRRGPRWQSMRLATRQQPAGINFVVGDVKGNDSVSQREILMEGLSKSLETDLWGANIWQQDVPELSCKVFLGQIQCGKRS